MKCHIFDDLSHRQRWRCSLQRVDIQLGIVKIIEQFMNIYVIRKVLCSRWLGHCCGCYAFFERLAICCSIRIVTLIVMPHGTSAPVEQIMTIASIRESSKGIGVSCIVLRSMIIGTLCGSWFGLCFVAVSILGGERENSGTSTHNKDLMLWCEREEVRYKADKIR